MNMDSFGHKLPNGKKVGARESHETNFVTIFFGVECFTQMQISSTLFSTFLCST